MGKNKANYLHRSDLHEAVIIKLLRAHGANPNQSNHHGQTPIGLAKLIANYDLISFFSDPVAGI